MLYSQKVLDHFHNPHNHGEISSPSASAQVGNPVCGDIIKFDLEIGQRPKDDGLNESYIKDVKFQTMGCAAAISVSSVMTDMVIGQSLEQASQVSFEDIVKELDGLPPIKIHCAQLARECLLKAIEHYEESQ